MDWESAVPWSLPPPFFDSSPIKDVRSCCSLQSLPCSWHNKQILASWKKIGWVKRRKSEMGGCEELWESLSIFWCFKRISKKEMFRGLKDKFRSMTSSVPCECVISLGGCCFRHVHWILLDYIHPCGSGTGFKLVGIDPSLPFEFLFVFFVVNTGTGQGLWRK